MLKPYGLEAIARLGSLVVIGAMMAVPLVRGGRWIWDRQRSEPLNWGRFIVRVGLAAIVIGSLACIPLPHHLSAPVVIEPSGAMRVYVTVPGTLVEAVEAGQHVRAGKRSPAWRIAISKWS